MFNEDDLIPISALQHFLFCERQCGLIHIECVWLENGYTAEGRALHEHVHTEGKVRRRAERRENAMALRSLSLGIVGQADLVELRVDANNHVISALPVEFKRGTNKSDDCDRVQLCAQALCLEEMLGIAVPLGEFFYLGDHRRTRVSIDEALRGTTTLSIGRIRALLDSGITPTARYEPKKCDRCSLLSVCMPRISGRNRPANRYVETMIEAIRKDCAI